MQLSVNKIVSIHLTDVQKDYNEVVTNFVKLELCKYLLKKYPDTSTIVDVKEEQYQMQEELINA